jgi:hypothetical protein
VANLVVESNLTLENAELALAGLWQAEDDGVLNPDYERSPSRRGRSHITGPLP